MAAELREKQCPEAAVAALEAFLAEGGLSLERAGALCGDEALAGEVRRVIETSRALSGGRYGVEFTPSLVRGQGYYTGMVFEVTCAGFSRRDRGGGRYDDMIGKFLGQEGVRPWLFHRL